MQVDFVAAPGEEERRGVRLTHASTGTVVVATERETRKANLAAALERMEEALGMAESRRRKKENLPRDATPLPANRTARDNATHDLGPVGVGRQVMTWPECICPNQKTVAQNLTEIKLKANRERHPEVGVKADECLTHPPDYPGRLTLGQHITKVQNCWDEAQTTNPDWEWIKKELDHAP